MYLSFGILQIRLPIHEGQTPPGPNRAVQIRRFLATVRYILYQNITKNWVVVLRALAVTTGAIYGLKILY